MSHSTPCDACAAPCCRHYYVSLEGNDIFRIAHELCLPVGEFVSLRRLDQPDSDCRIILEGDLPAEDRHYYGITLRKVPDTNPQYPWKCIFLVETATRGRCGIYGPRPTVCKLYPTSSHDGVIAMDGGGRYCPPKSWQLSHMNMEDTLISWRMFLWQRVIYREVIDGWNERVIAFSEVHAEEDLFAFVLQVYQALREHTPDLCTPASLDWPHERMCSSIDGVLRNMGWRSDETVRAAQPDIGMEPAKVLLLRATDEHALILDPDEELDPVGAEMAKRLGMDKSSILNRMR